LKLGAKLQISKKIEESIYNFVKSEG